MPNKKLRAQLNDIVQVLKCTTPKKIWNAILLTTSYYWSKQKKVPHVWGMPYSISLEPTTSCNLRCPECPSGLRSFTRPTGMLEPENFDRWLSQVKDTLIYLIFYFQGEPFLNRSFLKLVKRASEAGVYTATSTNAHYLNPQVAKETVESGLKRLIISIDGTTQEVYEQYRIGGKLEKVIEGTKNILKARKDLKSSTPMVVFQFLVVRPNEHQILDVIKLAEDLGVDDVWFKTAQIYEFENGSPLIPDNPKYSRYRKQPDGTFKIKNQLLNQCWKMWSSCVVTWDGTVVPCCFDKDAEHPMGNLQTEDFSNLWHGKEYGIFREKILLARSSIEICTNCTEGTKVWSDA